ncbi:hypothetical protein CMT92_07320 [Elizabethkingia anophelis]|uniref:hypothetical protein n=1 Tax=Elizabethkingia anophelis TaxID=1117645 RepID=UPI0021A53CC1|nr:hypothetical protein [Elizabethkingia anophelis]MCT3871765.1 hypothetical protein [Elizabethkingia anophelis]MDV3847461.1 hypothetical protein [Elizabethkingia anophelis]
MEAKITQQQLKELLVNGEIIITTKEIIREAVKENITGLLEWDDFHDFSKGASAISEEQENNIADWVIDYITGE